MFKNYLLKNEHSIRKWQWEGAPSEKVDLCAPPPEKNTLIAQACETLNQSQWRILMQEEIMINS